MIDAFLRRSECVHIRFATGQPSYPFVDKPGILPGAEATIVADPAWKDIIADRAVPPLKPRQQAGPSIREKFELNRPARFLQHDDGSRSDLRSADDAADFHGDKVATAQLAVDRKAEQCPIPQAALIEAKSDLPNLLGLQGPLRADGAPRDQTGRLEDALTHGFRHFHDHSPMARISHLKNGCISTVENCVRSWRAGCIVATAEHQLTKFANLCYLFGLGGCHGYDEHLTA